MLQGFSSGNIEANCLIARLWESAGLLREQDGGWPCGTAFQPMTPEVQPTQYILVLLQSFLVDEDLQFDHHQAGGFQTLPCMLSSTIICRECFC